MCAVYSNADEVLVWLGAEAEDSNAASEFVSFIAAKFRGFSSDILASVETVMAQPDFPGLEDQRWKAFLNLMCRPWFRLIWIQQEAFLASSIVSLCGHTEIPWVDSIDMAVMSYSRGLSRFVAIAIAGDLDLFWKYHQSIRSLANINAAH
jgi:hypothetical protein